MNSALQDGCRHMGLRGHGYICHTGRAGYATAEYLAHGASILPEVHHVLRHANAKIMKVYVDVVGTLASAQSQQLEKAHKEVADTCAMTYLPIIISWQILLLLEIKLAGLLLGKAP